jgi:hypothetical protein
VYGTMALLLCTHYNATYDVAFKFAGSDQEIWIRNLTYLNPVPATLEVPFDVTGSYYYDLSHPTSAYTAIMWAFNQLLVGTGTTNPIFSQKVPNYIGTLAQTTALGNFIEGSMRLRSLLNKCSATSRLVSSTQISSCKSQYCAFLNPLTQKNSTD